MRHFSQKCCRFCDACPLPTHTQMALWPGSGTVSRTDGPTRSVGATPSRNNSSGHLLRLPTGVWQDLSHFVMFFGVGRRGTGFFGGFPRGAPAFLSQVPDPRLPWPSLAARTAAVGSKRTGGEGGRSGGDRARSRVGHRWPTSAHGASGGHERTESQETREDPRRRGSWGVGVALGRRCLSVRGGQRRAKRPGLVLTNRDCWPLTTTSRQTAAQSVASGVLPPGEVQ